MFRRLVMSHWRRHGRHDLPWRRTTDPYRILVSEVMLQQTQVPRVVDKYREFLRAFPTFRALARSGPARVLKVWQGLGYNRRALQLYRCAGAVVGGSGGTLPREYDALCGLPGIGPYTAGAVLAFAFDIPQPIIETNIRRVYLHHFFPRSRNVHDARLMPLIERHVSQVHSPRIWYGALMDYGTHLASEVVNPNRRSRHHTRQTVFEGSDRQVRGSVLRALASRSRLIAANIARAAHVPVERIRGLLPVLEREGFIRRCRHTWCVHNPHWSLSDR